MRFCLQYLTIKSIVDYLYLSDFVLLFVLTLYKKYASLHIFEKKLPSRLSFGNSRRQNKREKITCGNPVII